MITLKYTENIAVLVQNGLDVYMFFFSKFETISWNKKNWMEQQNVDIIEIHSKDILVSTQNKNVILRTFVYNC